MYKQYSAKELIDRATKKPENYSLCFSQECPLRDHCLRAIEASKDSGEQLYVRAVNPMAVKNSTDGVCPAYRDSRNTIKYAIGFRERMKEINQDTRRVYQTLHSIFSNTHYYDMVNGNTLITPEEQAIIRSTAEKYGQSFPEDAFDIVIEGKVW